MSTLNYTCLTASGRSFDIAFPLHEQTRSKERVAEMLGELLRALSRTVETHRDVSDGDVLQSLAMALAIRGRMIEGADPRAVREAADALVAMAFEAAQSAPMARGGRG